MPPPVVAKPTRQEKFHQRFLHEIPENEELIQYYSCTLHKDFYLQHGALYITKNFVCFRSVLFGQERKLIIPTSDILHVYKVNTLRLIPSGIVVDTGARKYQFEAFGGGRHLAYTTLQNVAINSVNSVHLRKGLKDQHRFTKSQSSCTLSSLHVSGQNRDNFSLEPLSTSIMHCYVDNIRRQSRAHTCTVPPSICITPPDTPASPASSVFYDRESTDDDVDGCTEDRQREEQPVAFQSSRSHSRPENKETFVNVLSPRVVLYLGYALCSLLALTAVFQFYHEINLFSDETPRSFKTFPSCLLHFPQTAMTNETVRLMQSLQEVVSRISNQVQHLEDTWSIS